jgi:predicted DCC family thiol-disulfide oxidoreductase YuxK
MENHAEDMSKRTVYFDDECALCDASAKKIRDEIGAQIVGASDESSKFIDKNALMRDVHAMDEHGVMHRGIDAVIVILRWHPQGKYVAPILALPGIKQIGAGVYRIVAANRHRWFGKR